MKRTNKIVLDDGSISYEEKNLKKLLNLNYLMLTNRAKLIGKHNLPALHCNTKVFPDYLALYTEPCNYHKTNNTAVCFFLYDDKFDGKDGLYNSIYYNDQKALKKYKERFKDVKFFITPDYSLFGDIDDIENRYRIKKGRIVGLWLTIEMKAVVIPLISFPTLESLDFVLDGLEDCNVVAFSTKGYIRDKVEKEILKESIRYTGTMSRFRTTQIPFSIQT
ncbi:MAG: DUF4417 domain-containing protein, partial [Bacillota bacterium]|nr:DUF4417 domain-containing protein [Bacillota bacterium]